MRLDRLLLLAGATLLGLGAIAAIGADSENDPLALRLIPALLFRLHRPLTGGGDFPPSLSSAGIVVVYVVPGTVLLALGLLYRRRLIEGGAHRDSASDDR